MPQRYKLKIKGQMYDIGADSEEEAIQKGLQFSSNSLPTEQQTTQLQGPYGREELGEPDRFEEMTKTAWGATGLPSLWNVATGQAQPEDLINLAGVGTALAFGPAGLGAKLLQVVGSALGAGVMQGALGPEAHQGAESLRTAYPESKLASLAAGGLEALPGLGGAIVGGAMASPQSFEGALIGQGKRAIPRSKEAQSVVNMGAKIAGKEAPLLASTNEADISGALREIRKSAGGDIDNIVSIASKRVKPNKNLGMQISKELRRIVGKYEPKAGSEISKHESDLNKLILEADNAKNISTLSDAQEFKARLQKIVSDSRKPNAPVEFRGPQLPEAGEAVRNIVASKLPAKLRPQYDAANQKFSSFATLHDMVNKSMSRGELSTGKLVSNWKSLDKSKLPPEVVSQLETAFKQKGGNGLLTAITSLSMHPLRTSKRFLANMITRGESGNIFNPERIYQQNNYKQSPLNILSQAVAGGTAGYQTAKSNSAPSPYLQALQSQ